MIDDGGEIYDVLLPFYGGFVLLFCFLQRCVQFIGRAAGDRDRDRRALMEWRWSLEGVAGAVPFCFR